MSQDPSDDPAADDRSGGPPARPPDRPPARPPARPTARLPARLAARYVRARAVTIERDGGPGLVLRWSARAPLVTTAALAVVIGVILVATFGVPPVSPLLLIPVVCGPIYPWLRLEARAQAAWRDQRADRSAG